MVKNILKNDGINNTNLLPKAIFLMGPTTSGKTSLAIDLRKVLPVELISVDSTLIYRGMNIGTAKPSTEELHVAPHHLLDILDPAQIYSAADFRRDALVEMSKSVAAGRIPLLVGGTMFYYKVLLEGISSLPSSNLEIRTRIKQQAAKQGWASLYKRLKAIDQVSAERIHPNDSQRISRALEIFFVSGKTLTELKQISKEIFPYQVYQFAIAPTSSKLIHQRIEQRFYRMLATGFEEEVLALFSRGDLNLDMPSIRCIGYRHMWSWLQGNTSYDEMVHGTICATRQLAKRQMTWLRNWKGIHWLDSEKPKKAFNEILRTVDVISN